MSRKRLRRLRWPQVALVVLIGALATGYLLSAVDRGATPGTVPLSALPPQVAQTVQLIEAGGPFRYREDGEVYDNAGGQLPGEARGFYHEYTVPTPGSADRGARRIVTGANGEFYYTADHYRSFRRVDLHR